MNKQRHIILKALYVFFEEQEKRKHDGGGPTTYGQTLTVIELNNLTGLKADQIQSICYTLINAKHIELYEKDENNKAHRYLITDPGRQAYIDKFYLNQIWYRGRDFWFKTLPIVISAGTLIWTITVNSELKKKVSEQEQKIQILQAATKSNKSK